MPANIRSQGLQTRVHNFTSLGIGVAASHLSYALGEDLDASVCKAQQLHQVQEHQ